MADIKSRKKALVGTVVSTKMAKTVVVLVKSRIMHPVYKKYITKSKRYKAHYEKDDLNIGDVVQIRETRPLSKDKRWYVEKILERVEK